MSRSDSEDFLSKTSFGFIPAGTSNGLYASIAAFGQEKDSIKSSAFVIAKGRSTKLDITKLDLEYYHKEPLYIFSSLYFGEAKSHQVDFSGNGQQVSTINDKFNSREFKPYAWRNLKL